MFELAPGVWQLEGRPRDLINTYLVHDVLIDSGTRYDGGRILAQVRDREVVAHALTHAHGDHLGSSHRVCTELGIPFWVGTHDAAAAADSHTLARAVIPQSLRGSPLPLSRLTRLMNAAHAGPGHPVARELREGDEVAGFQVLHVPGHTPGHVAFWRESDRVLIAGDVAWNFHFYGGWPGLTEPSPISCSNRAENRDSARRLAALEPELICFGHGPPLRDPRRFTEFAERLSQT
jgi:glyoxylase-like metal-dependent hydrolase (beta-lactamase superfamily II)